MGSCNYTMAALARSYQKFLRVAPQAPALARQMSGGHRGGYETWKKGFFFAAIPIIILGHVNAFGMADENAHAAPEFVPYDHLRIRSKKFPWGDGNHSLFHNSHMNAFLTAMKSTKLCSPQPLTFVPQVPRIRFVEYIPVVFLALLVIVVTLDPYILGYILK